MLVSTSSHVSKTWTAFRTDADGVMHAIRHAGGTPLALSATATVRGIEMLNILKDAEVSRVFAGT